MCYRSILVNLDIDGPVEPVIKAAADLAGRFQARLIGFCAADAPMPVAGPDSTGLAGEAWRLMREDIQSRFKELHGAFDGLAASTAATEWREALDSPSRALAEASRAADLIVMSAVEGAGTGDAYRRADPGSIALQAGRPLLILAGGVEAVPVNKAAVAWKDTREARRAVADAVPLLKSADEVTVVSVAAEAGRWLRDSLADIVAFLSRHGVEARSVLVEATDEHRALSDWLDQTSPDLIVSGAYGHSRLREWAFGGVTRSLLDETGRNRFMAS